MTLNGWNTTLAEIKVLRSPPEKCERDIAGFCAHDPLLFHPNFGIFPLHQIAHVGVSPNINHKVIIREIIFEVFQAMWSRNSRYLDVTHGQTDRHMDGQTTYCGITALCVASRGKNRDAQTFPSKFLTLKRTILHRNTQFLVGFLVVPICVTLNDR